MVWIGWRGLSVFVEAVHMEGLPEVLIDWGQASGYDWSSVPWGEVNSYFLSIYEEPASCQASFALIRLRCN